MRVLLWAGLIILVLGLLSFFVPLPHTEREGISAGGVTLGVETRHSEKLSPMAGIALVLAGAGMMAVGARGRGRG